MRREDEETDLRLRAAEAALADAQRKAERSAPVAERSRELAQANSIASIIRDSLRVQPVSKNHQ